MVTRIGSALDERRGFGRGRRNAVLYAFVILLLAIGGRPPTSFAQRATAPHVFDDCSGSAWCPRMVVVPSGSFAMGSASTELGRFEDEGPQRRVTIKRLAVGEFPITRGQWRVFVAAEKRPVIQAPCDYARSARPSWVEVGFPQTDDDPVVCITWNEAQDYARWLSRRTGRRYRLLTEAEWEYAARAGSATPFPWGAVADHDHANYGLDECCGPRVLGRDRWENTSPVGSFPPNAFGLFDMHGDVFEWVQDCYTPSYAGRPTDGSAMEVRSCSRRVARGGVYADTWKVMRSAARNYAPPTDKQSIDTYRSAGFGFRVARTLP